MKIHKRFRFHPTYAIIALIIFVIEVLIALYVKDQFIRPYIGDVLVVILIYCFLKSFFDTPTVATAIAVLIFAFLIEGLQYFQYVKLLGLEKSTFANIVMGNYFAWEDIISYTAGILIVIIVEKVDLRSLKTS
ncbi:MAG: DUF2809 domain-containing protein [Pedobacter sp.]|nr:DUF2809 domain-containing protein [Pedobacter sp.]MDQ8053008.1 DUF2809 domain-containing protein [Pedobacter sp.]